MPQPVHWRSWSWTVLWRPTRPFRTNTPKRCPFHYREQECKSRKSRNTWSNRQIWSWSTEWSRAKANRVLLREHTGHSKHSLPTTQEKTLHIVITRWSSLKSDWLYSLQPKMEMLPQESYILLWNYHCTITIHQMVFKQTEKKKKPGILQISLENVHM